MKKSLLLLLAAFMLSLTTVAMDLGPNQLLLGHYKTDSLATTGWGQSFLVGVNPIAIDLSPDELALYQGGRIVSFRIGLAAEAPISRVFVIPVDITGKPTDDIVEWPCEVSGQQGWNIIELPAPYLINLPDGYSLRIGFDYEQLERNSKPISAVKVGTIYPTYIKRNGNWMNYGVNTFGNLSLQCVVENENFPQYVLRLNNLTCKTNILIGDELPYTFQIANLGVGYVGPGELVMEVAIDGNVVKTITNPEALTSEYFTIEDVVPTEGLTGGLHTLSVKTITINGEPIANPAYRATTFKTFEYGFSRQMHLVEQFTSTGCTYCPQGTANIVNLTNMRNDIAWVAVHENMNNTDPFRTAQTDSITSYEGIDGFPEGTFDRTAGVSNANEVYAVITGMTAASMSTFLDYVAETPSWATVNVNSTFDAQTREAHITIDGKLVPNYEDFMGNNSKLTVYITEDGLVAPQVSGGNNYVHNNVLRKALVSVKGVALKKEGDTYKNEFTYTIPSTWNADNLNIVAFVSRPLGNQLTDIYVTNANKRKLGEFDEPEYEQGDTDGDGKITIGDVTQLIDYLLSEAGTISSQEAADCDGDGKITIGDVTSLIDYLLSGQWSE